MSSSELWLLEHVRIDGEGVVDCVVHDGVIAEIGPDLNVPADAQVLSAGGATVIPGLADHHIHLRALAAARRSFDVAGAPLESALQAPGDGPLRIVGAPHGPTRPELDALWPDRPVRVQHRSGALWTVNTAALGLLGGAATKEERETGQFWRRPPRLGVPSASRPDELDELGARLAAHGVTHLTDATPDLDDFGLFARVPQHVVSLSAAGSGPRKIVLSDHRPIDLHEVSHQVDEAHVAGRGVAIHAVTAAALAVAIASLDVVGVHPADRIEHAAVCSDAAAEQLARLTVPVVTQPTVYARYGAHFLRESEQSERDLLWRYAGLQKAGVRVAASSDAPFGDADPWATVRAAASQLHPTERVDAEVALRSMFTAPLDPAGPPRLVEVGAPADLCLLADAVVPTLERVVGGGEAHVLATFIEGRLAHRT